jgi:hypothetical protein
MLALLRAEERWRARDAAILGCVMAWAATTDVYYAVFCLLLAAVVLASRIVHLRRASAATRAAIIRRATDIVLICLAGLIAALAIGRGWRFTFLGANISMRGLYTPVLLLTVVGIVRLALQFPPRLVLQRAHVMHAIRLGLVTAGVSAALLSPVLVALGQRVAEHGIEASPTLWRSSPHGIDLAAIALPNPNHPFAPAVVREWLTQQPQAYLENVASVPIVAMIVLLVAWRAGWRPPKTWIAVTAGFALLALGPFVHVAGVNTYVPGPWALLRYVPIVGLVRTPARFSVVVMLGIAVLFAMALAALRARLPRLRVALLAATAALLVGELLPAPRQIYAAPVPAFYRRVAEDPRRDVRVLELPFGIRDGTTSVGNFTARSQFYQTVHQKPLVGGYLSRVSRRRMRDLERMPVLGALSTLSSGRELPPEALQRLLDLGPRFLHRANIGYVVIDHRRASPDLAHLAIQAFCLERIAREGDLALYRPLL